MKVKSTVVLFSVITLVQCGPTKKLNKRSSTFGLPRADYQYSTQVGSFGQNQQQTSNPFLSTLLTEQHSTNNVQVQPHIIINQQSIQPQLISTVNHQLPANVLQTNPFFNNQINLSDSKFARTQTYSLENRLKNNPFLKESYNPTLYSVQQQYSSTPLHSSQVVQSPQLLTEAVTTASNTEKIFTTPLSVSQSASTLYVLARLQDESTGIDGDDAAIKQADEGFGKKINDLAKVDSHVLDQEPLKPQSIYNINLSPVLAQPQLQTNTQQRNPFLNNQIDLSGSKYAYIQSELVHNPLESNPFLKQSPLYSIQQQYNPASLKTDQSLLPEVKTVPINLEKKVTTPLLVPQYGKVQDRNLGTTHLPTTYDNEDEGSKYAKYSFGTEVRDDINQNVQLRQESRDGLAVKGHYSYSDGYVKVTVHYEADENGYRVTGEDKELIGNGPEHNPKGKAEIKSYIDDKTVNYAITSEEINS